MLKSKYFALALGGLMTISAGTALAQAVSNVIAGVTVSFSKGGAATIASNSNKLIVFAADKEAQANSTINDAKKLASDGSNAVTAPANNFFLIVSNGNVSAPAATLFRCSILSNERVQCSTVSHYKGATSTPTSNR